MKKIAIIGGGLSGLYAAKLLQKKYHVTLFEARNRLGGRVCTEDGFDMGPSWIWPHQSRILQLARSLDLELFLQYDKGEALFDKPSGVQRFNPPSHDLSYRIQGGIGELIYCLSKLLTATQIHLDEPVVSLTHLDQQIELITKIGKYKFDDVIISLPPRLVLQTIQLQPPLSDAIQHQFASMHTWMGNAIKCVIEFKEPFWRELGLSGFCFSHIGPMGEIHDACTSDRYALFGFVRSNACLDTLENDVKIQIRRLYGSYADHIIGFHFIDWRNESYTSTAADAVPLSSHPNYGIHARHFDDKIHFIGTETSYTEGGYLEGAIISTEDSMKHF